MRGREQSGIGAHERGSALLLLPATVLVLVILGAIAVDSAVVLLAERELSAAAAAAANDGVAVGMDDAAFYNEGRVALDEARAMSAALEAIRHRDIRGLTNVRTAVRADGDRLTVELRGEVPLIFARAIPGMAGSASAHSSATARVEER